MGSSAPQVVVALLLLSQKAADSVHGLAQTAAHKQIRPRAL